MEKIENMLITEKVYSSRFFYWIVFLVFLNSEIGLHLDNNNENCRHLTDSNIRKNVILKNEKTVVILHCIQYEISLQHAYKTLIDVVN